MGPWKILPLWGFCLAPNSLVPFWGKGIFLFSVSGVPHKQGFQRWILGIGAWKVPLLVRIWAYGDGRPDIQALVPATEGACLKTGSGWGSQCVLLAQGGHPEWAWSHGSCRFLLL